MFSGLRHFSRTEGVNALLLSTAIDLGTFGEWAGRRGQGYGPLQSKGMCLLDLPSLSHSKPKASARSAVAVPHVATCPGPTSLPGGLCSCTSCLGGVVGPVSASALATTFPGISALQEVRSSATSNPMGTNSTPLTSPMNSATT